MEYPPCSPDLTPNDFWLFTKMKSALKGRRFQGIENIQKCNESTESYSTTVVPKLFPTGAAPLG
jgi:hypothetical protein